MNEKTSITGRSATEGHKALSFRDGIYRLKLHLPAFDAPYEVLLHGVSRLSDALRIARFFEDRMLSDIL
jgi:hypothetical protein